MKDQLEYRIKLAKKTHSKQMDIYMNPLLKTSER